MATYINKKSTLYKTRKYSMLVLLQLNTYIQTSQYFSSNNSW